MPKTIIKAGESFAVELVYLANNPHNCLNAFLWLVENDLPFQLRLNPRGSGWLWKCHCCGDIIEVDVEE